MLMVIKQHVPDVPDRQVKLGEGMVNLPGPRMVADQPDGHFESEPGGEQPVHNDVVQAPGDPVAIPHHMQSHRRRVVCWQGRRAAHRPHARLVKFRHRPVGGHGR